MTNSRPIVRKAEHVAVPVAPSRSFAPIVRGDARLLILGSLPGQRSLEAGEYYAHPQNAFWRIMRDVLGAAGSYAERCQMLLDHQIALWDVLFESVRPGSMDADIRLDTSQVNDFQTFFRENGQIRRVCFNGQKAQAMFMRLVGTGSAAHVQEYLTLPSTSPAYASMCYAEKLKRWQGALELAGES